MARPHNPNDKETMELFKMFFSKMYNRGHDRYVNLEFFQGGKQDLIEHFETKLLLLKDMGLLFMKHLGTSEEDAKLLIENDPITAFIMANAELSEAKSTKYINIDVDLSNKEILEIVKKEREKISKNENDFYNRTNTKELSTKLADALYIFDCKKFYLPNSFIENEITKYYGHGTNIKNSTIKKYFESTLEIYKTL